MQRLLRAALALLPMTLASAGWAAAQAPTAAPSRPRAHAHPHTRALAVQVGKASIYSHRFAGRRMADGARMDPRRDNAASKALPLGTRAVVTNLANGRSATVTIEDRGPHVPGRIVDLSPATAEKIGLTRKEGLAHVEVRPITAPPETDVAEN